LSRQCNENAAACNDPCKNSHRLASYLKGGVFYTEVTPPGGRGKMRIANSSDILQAVIDATPDAIFVKDLQGCYVLVNRAAARFLDRPPADIVGRNDLELYPEETARQFMQDDRRVLATGQPQAFEGVARNADGTSQAYLVTKGVYRDSDGKILGVFGISHDMTELRQAHETLEQTREALFRAQKMEAVGQLTGGVAHDFNNILAVILGNVELLRLHVRRARRRKDPDIEELVETIVRSVLHGKELTGHLLSFSRRRQLNPEPVDLNALVDGIVRLLGRTLGAAIRIETAISRDIGKALVDPVALEAAVLNVALNARDAMPGGGVLTIRTSRAEITALPAADDDLQPGPYAALSLEDTGFGMPPEVVARVFEPFFTTKADSGGTGLGLSMVYGFAKQSGGTVIIDSTPGRGTTVSMLLPLAQGEARSEAARGASIDGPAVSRRILLVEDEADVRETVRRQLESLGHRVVVAGAAAEALPLIHGPNAPDVLLTDVVLGTGMNGVDLVDAARGERPGLPVIFMSGYSTVPDAQRIRESGAPLLTKPSTISQLERAVNTVCSGV
jgi:PAS domain S-box-containing protein